MQDETADIDPALLDLRREAVGINAEDRRCLAEVQPIVECAWDDFLVTLYDRLRMHPDMASLLGPDGTIERLVRKQHGYLKQLFGAPHDLDHARRLQRIGLVHYQLRVTPQWFIATYGHFICEHIDHLSTAIGDHHRTLRTVLALVRSVFYDMVFVLDAYGEGELHAIRERRSSRLFAADTAGTAHRGATQDRTEARKRPDWGAHISLTSEEIDQRRAYIGIDESVLAALRSMEIAVAAQLEPMLDDFYAFTASHPETAGLVPESTVARLKRQVASYWVEVMASDFDRPYSSSRMRIGLMHERIGLSLQWYLSGLSRQLVTLLETVMLARPGDWSAAKAMVRAVLFDVTFVTDAYMEARADALRRLGGYAEELIAGLTSAVAVIDAEARVIGANPAMIEMLRTSAAMLYRMPVATALPLAEIKSLLSRVLRESRPRATATVRFMGRRLMITATRLTPGPQIPGGGCALVLDDIAELQQLGEEYATRERHLAQVVTTVDAVIWELDRESQTILSISEPVIRLTGYRDMYFIGRQNAWLGAIAPGDRERFRHRLDALVEGSEATIEHRVRHTDGTERWVYSRVGARRNATGASVWYGVSIDISDSKRAEARRLQSIGLLSSSIAHVLNNSLMSISGSIELHARPLGGATRFPELERALGEVGRATTVTRQLLAFAGRQDLRPRPVDCNEVVRQCGATLRIAYGRALRVSIDAAEQLWLTTLDAERLSAAIRCLADNTSESADRRLSLTIRTANIPADHALADPDAPQSGEDWVEVAVSDDGPGMSADVRRRAVDPFFTTKSEEQGHYGLGLSMAYGFAAQSGGYLQLESSEGSGTTVRMRFPRLRPAGHAPRVVDAPDRSVLVVDDSPVVLPIVAELVQVLGYSVVRAASASEALKLIESQPFDVLLSDVRLGPGSDGIELARAAEQLRPAMRVVLMSGYTGRELGLDHAPQRYRFLQKPFSIAELGQALGVD